MWNQVYNPFGNTALSTIAAAIPVVTLLVLIASGKVKAHLAAIIALVLANLVAIFLFTMPANMAIRASLLGVVAGFFPIGWIVLNVIFMYQLTVTAGPVRSAQARGRRCHRRPAIAAAADRVFVRRVLRGRVGLRHAGGDHRRDPDRAWLLAARRFRPVADRQYRAGRLWRARYPDPGPGFGDRSRSLHPGCDGRTAVAGFLADRAVLGGMGVRGLEGHEGSLAGHPGHRRVVRDPAIRDLELHQSLDRRYRRFADFDGLPVLFLQVWQPKVLWLSPALRGNDEFASTMPPAKLIDHDAADASGTVHRAAAVDHPLRHPADLGHGLVQGRGESDLHLELSGSRAAQHDQQGCRRWSPKPTPEGAVFAFTYLSFTGTGMLIAAIISGFSWACRRARWSRNTAAPSGLCAIR